MMEKFNKSHPGKVRIVGISIESDKDKVLQRVESKGWNAVEHYIFMRKKFPGERHPCETSYSFSGIPHVFLIDKNGKINYFGHPSTINLEERIE